MLRTTTLRTVPAVVLAVALLAGCGTDGDPAAAPSASPSTSTSTTATDGAALSGSWAADVPGEEPGAVLVLGDGGVMVARECGAVQGSWSHDTAGRFAASLWSSSNRCSRGLDSVETPAWLGDATAARVEDGRLVLIDDAGTVLASLARTEQPTGDELDGSFRYGRLGDPARPLPEPLPLPAGLREATRDELLGTWLAETDPSRRTRTVDPHATLRDDGVVSGTDGCNGTGGSWVYRDGVLLGLGGAQTLIGCANIEVASWFTQARRAGFDGDVLVLVDGSGEELGRVIRGTPRCGGEQANLCG